ncbi:MAG: exonuclease domain-containing protein [Lachnospiraceae bacterium]|nr:exonuclease domain-containing protein [Lachnospiraceae bacterium]
MNHVVVDFEMNTVARKSEVRKICNMEIIEIGAVMLDDELKEISSFRTYVKPEHNDVIAPNISRLTGITEAMVANSPKFRDALERFANWCQEGGDEILIHTWSDSDFIQVSKELELKTEKLTPYEEKLMNLKWHDFQNEFGSNMGFERQLSLAMALEMAGIEFEGKEHDALDDARNTAQLLQVFNDKELFETTLRKIEEAMKPSSLENTLGNLFDWSQFIVTSEE